MIGSFFFLMRESVLNLRRQGLLTLACITTAAIALTIFGAFTLLAWHVHSIADAIPRRFEVHAFLNGEASRAQTEILVGQIGKLPGVVQVNLVPKERAWAEMRQRYPHKADLEGLSENPLPDKLEIVAATPERTLEVADAVRRFPLIDHVNEGREVLRKLLAIAGVVRMIGIAVACLLALGTMAIISNAIRITLYARRRDIRVMQLVGATNSFIRMPFVVEGIVEGAAGGAVACAVMFGALQYLMTRVLPDMPFVNEFRLALDVPMFCAALVAGGALLGMLGSLFSLRRFLPAA
jgi:cell division transport system permease protein